MSSLVRTLQKRILRNKFGFSRQRDSIRMDAGGKPYIHRSTRSDPGPIVDRDDNVVGRHYPTLLKPSADDLPTTASE